MLMPIWIAAMVVLPEAHHWYALKRVQLKRAQHPLSVAFSTSEEEKNQSAAHSITTCTNDAVGLGKAAMRP